MHYLKANQYTYLAGEINALYHEAAVKTGVSDMLIPEPFLEKEPSRQLFIWQVNRRDFMI